MIVKKERLPVFIKSYEWLNDNTENSFVMKQSNMVD